MPRSRGRGRWRGRPAGREGDTGACAGRGGAIA